MPAVSLLSFKKLRQEEGKNACVSQAELPTLQASLMKPAKIVDLPLRTSCMENRCQVKNTSKEGHRS